MELRQLEYFVAVAEETNFTKAAARVHVAQPGVSAQIRKLERELGQALLDRSGRAVRLTEAGAAVLPYARAALAAVDGARLAVDELAGLLRGRVAVGTVTSVPSEDLDLPGFLADFHRDHPAVEITLSEDNSDRMIEALRDGRLDLALVNLGGKTPPGIETRVVTDERLVAAVNRDEPLAARTAITLKAIRERPLISLPRGTGIRSLIDEACAAAGFRPRIAFEAGDPNVLARLASQGLGVAILPESLAYFYREELHAIAITRPRLRGRLELAWRAEGPINPAARALINRARDMLEDPPAQPL
jgi:DNA-binding transcriptional LysR family regulator